jgi:hypothetical protein
MKVTDAEILKAIWREQIKKTAHGVIDNYIGGTKSVSYGQFRQGYAQNLYMISRQQLGLPLSKGHLGRRLKALISSGGPLQWDGREGNAYHFKCKASDDVYAAAREWWAGKGVPTGFDEENKRTRTALVDDFDGKVAQLQQDLLSKFGSMQP